MGDQRVPHTNNTHMTPADRVMAWNLYHNGASDKEIAEQIGFSTASVYAWRRRNLLPPKVTKRDAGRMGGNATKQQSAPGYYASIAKKRWDKDLVV